MDTEAGSSTAVELTRRLFVPEERWGWEYVDPGRGRPNPHAAREPRWEEPPPPDTSALESRRQQLAGKTPRRLTIVVVLVALSTAFNLLYPEWEGELFLPLIGTLYIGLHLGLLWNAGNAIKKVRQAAAEQRDDKWRQYQTALAAWQADIHAYELAEERRRAQADLFFPVGPQSAPSRIDVFGGTGDGWASLLATTGTSLLAGGTGILLLDLSERGVGGGLAVLADDAGCPVEVDELPSDSGRLPLLAGLPPDDVAEALADAFESARAVDPARRPGDGSVLRALDAELLGTVSRCLDGPATFARLAAGLRVLARPGEPAPSPSPSPSPSSPPSSSALSQSEVGRLLEQVHSVVPSPRVTDELQFLRMTLDVLAGGPGDAGGQGGDGGHHAGTGPAWWPVRGLHVIATSSRETSTRRKDLLDRVLFQVVLHRLRRLRGPAAPGMVVVAGADHLGRHVLEAFARHAEISGVRLVYMFERITEDTERFLGGHGGTSLIMRLGHAREAVSAAEFIGRGHSFVLSQVTEQVGKSFTTSDASSKGGQEGTSETEGTFGFQTKTSVRTPGTLSRLLSTSTTKGWNRSVTVSRSTTWERTHTISEGDQVNRGAIMQRSYEFTVEPTTIQQLPPTAFVLVDAAGARRAVLGDCNPGLVLLSRVSDRPHLPEAAPTGPAAIAGAHPGTLLQGGSSPTSPTGPAPEHPQPGDGLGPAGYGQPDDAARPFLPSHPPDVPGPGAHHRGQP